MPCQNVFTKSFLFRYHETMFKNSKLFKVQINSLILIVFSFMGIGCSSIYEYKPPSIVNTDVNEVAVAHKNKWRFGKNYNVASKTEILRKAEAACYAATENKAIFHSRHCDDRLNKKHCSLERFLFICESDGLKKNDRLRKESPVIRYSRAKAI